MYHRRKNKIRHYAAKIRFGIKNKISLSLSLSLSGIFEHETLVNGLKETAGNNGAEMGFGAAAKHKATDTGWTLF